MYKPFSISLEGLSCQELTVVLTLEGGSCHLSKLFILKSLTACSFSFTLPCLAGGLFYIEHIWRYSL